MSTHSQEQAGPAPDDALARATAKDHATIRARDAEEAHARKHSRLTRILGCMMVGGVILQFVGSSFGQQVDVGGIVYLIVGIGVLLGSQAGVRFAAFFGCLVMLGCLAQIIWSLAMAQPVVGRSGTFDHADPRFWITYICPAMYMFAEALLAFAALRQRQIIYWTRTVKICTVVLGSLLLVKAALTASADLKSKQTIHMFPNEVKMAENYLLAHGATIFGAPDKQQEALKVLPALHSIKFFEAEVMGWDWTNSASIPPDQLRRATHWVKLPSGEWGKIEFEFIDRGDKP